jgi:preprotein translocase subunit SecG
MIVFLVIVHVIVCVFLCLIVLLQQGKGADLAVFGGGASQAAFGARSATTLLHKLTTTFFVLFVVTSLALAVLQARPRASVMTGAGTAAPAAPAPVKK